MSDSMFITSGQKEFIKKIFSKRQKIVKEMMRLATLMLKKKNNFYSSKETTKKGEDMPRISRRYLPHV